MIRNACLAFYRTNLRHPLYALLTFGGLSLGIAVLILLTLFCRFESSFEAWLPGADHLYVLRSDYRLPVAPPASFFTSAGRILDDLTADRPDLLGTRLISSDVTLHVGGRSTHEQQTLVDPQFFRLFPLSFVAGDRESALSAPDGILLTRSMAQKYFGSTAVIGESLRLADDDGVKDCRIVGVIEDLPANTELQLDVIRPLTPSDGGFTSYTRMDGKTILFLPNEAAAAALDAQFDGFVDRHAGGPMMGDHPHEHLHLALVPLKSVHLQDAAARRTVVTLGLVGVLAFAVAALNTVNLATARSALRVREVAIRKSLGATGAKLRAQFLVEAVLTTLIAGLAALALVEVTLPLVNLFGGLSLRIDYLGDWPILLGLAGAILTVGLLAGIYPAVMLSSFRPALVLAAARSPQGGRRALQLRALLVGLQFAVVIGFFVMLGVFMRQIDHLDNADLGFQRDGLMLVPSLADPMMSPAQRDALATALAGIAGVRSATSSDSAPGTIADLWEPVGREGQGAAINDVHETVIGPEYFQTYGAQLLAGRLLDPAFGDDVQPLTPVGLPDHEQTAIIDAVINARAAHLLGFATPEEALGKLLVMGQNGKKRIVGVVGDLRFQPLREAGAGRIYFLALHPVFMPIAALRYQGVGAVEMRARIGAVWQKIAADVPFVAVSAADTLTGYYRIDRDHTHLFMLGALAAAAIGCMGLYGMAAFSASVRAREIGIRKVLGASREKIILLLLGQSLRPLLWANLLAWPVAYWGVSRWLTQFDDHIALNPLHFLVPSLVALLIASITVIGLAVASARTEPGKALRDE